MTFRTEVDHNDPRRDLPKDREIKVLKNKITIKKGGPYGHWTVHYERGAVPPELRGEWTDINDVKLRIRNYLDKHDKLTDKIEDQL